MVVYVLCDVVVVVRCGMWLRLYCIVLCCVCVVLCCVVRCGLWLLCD